MKTLFVSLLVLFATAQASANVYFNESAKDIGAILSNSVFSRYSAFTIATIRQGEIGQAQAYFVRLVKPFNTVDKGVCIEFVNPGKWEVKGHPYACED